MLKYNHPDFSNLNIDMDNAWSVDYPDDYCYEDDVDAPIDLNSITPDMAIKALEMIMSGELLLDNGDGKPELNIMTKV